MHSEIEKIENSIVVLEKIAKGVDPLTGEIIGENSFLNDPQMIRCFYFIADMLRNVSKGVYSNHKATDFVITGEQKKRVEFPQGKIGVNEFSRRVNECLDLYYSKKLTGVELNRRLKKMGILSEEKADDGKTRTVINDSSVFYGFEMEKREYNGRTYDAVVINDKGKKYLLDNLEGIMAENVS